ncbi:hypothetical protein [uncultured Cohaesibacter sp.]|uniref:hypothetical protein n=1 Tax=uncultured Cohaesibacter sp. TaxID=1002546 RepID=UPI003747A510
MEKQTAQAAMKALLETMKKEIEKAYVEVDLAIEYVDDGELNTAAGGMYITDQSLGKAQAVFNAFKTIHQVSFDGV